MQHSKLKQVDLTDLLKAALAIDVRVGAILVSGITCDTRQLTGGEIFCAIEGEHFDGNNFLEDAILKGAVCVVSKKPLTSQKHWQGGLAIPYFQVENVREAMALLACEFYGNPSRDLQVIGITGTNGKTTTATIISELSTKKSRALGTLSSESSLTTSNSPELQATLAGYLEDGVELVAMEVSSHGLSQHRVDGICFSVSLFLNLSQDHLDYHKNMKNYFKEKAKLFSQERTKLAIINVDTKWGRKLERTFSRQGQETIPFSKNDFEIISSDETGSKFMWESRECALSLAGSHNVVNAVVALKTLMTISQKEGTKGKALESNMDEWINRLTKLKSLSGRFEIVASNVAGHSVVVDYAHTPEALETSLKSIRGMKRTKNIITVFGCGGERDKQKRPEMGKVANDFADTIILTSDNSRSEETKNIISDISKGISKKEFHSEPDRKKAIEAALSIAKKGDVVLIAGKGHENTQHTKDGIIEFSDIEVVKELLDK